jgi:hypothetical protein
MDNLTQRTIDGLSLSIIDTTGYRLRMDSDICNLLLNKLQNVDIIEKIYKRGLLNYILPLNTIFYVISHSRHDIMPHIFC